MAKYTEDSIRSLDWREHIRLRPGMYIGKLGNGSASDDGIYVLFKEIMDNTIDEHTMGFGKQVEIKLKEDGSMNIRDYGRGIPLGKLVDCVSKINTGGKYDSEAFQKAVGLNGVGTKAVNALSEKFRVQAYRDGKTRFAEFEAGILLQESKDLDTNDPNGTSVLFTPDSSVFKSYRWDKEFLENQIWNYAFLNAGLKIHFNGQTYLSKNGLLDLLERKTDPEHIRYPIIHLKGEDIEVAITHGNQYGEEYYAFVNGQHTTQGGTHLQAYRAAIVKVLRDFYGKQYDSSDIRMGMIAAISVRVQEPVFESQTKTKLGSLTIAPEGLSINTFVANFLEKALDDYLHKHPDVAKKMQDRIVQSERERKEIAGIKKLANERAKKANLHNKKLRDCLLHFSDKAKPGHESTTIFITEGDSASGSITKARNVSLQAVFSLRGKPLNCYNLSKKIVYENEEFNLLQHALDIENSVDDLRYARVVIATDADVDGMHIRLLLLTFFLQFFPELVRRGHLFIMNTPLFRVRNKKDTFYCYSETEKLAAMKKLGSTAEVTRFKGLGEISPDEFAGFIGDDIRLEPVSVSDKTKIDQLLGYYMGKNSMERQNFIIDNLRVEVDELVEK
jgi:topoisomerase-4 subunit B